MATLKPKKVTANYPPDDYGKIISTESMAAALIQVKPDVKVTETATPKVKDVPLQTSIKPDFSFLKEEEEEEEILVVPVSWEGKASLEEFMKKQEFLKVGPFNNTPIHTLIHEELKDVAREGKTNYNSLVNSILYHWYQSYKSEILVARKKAYKNKRSL